MSRSSKELVCHFLEEVVNRGNRHLLPELVAPDHVRHAPDGDLYGPEGLRIELHEWRLGFPDLELAIEDLIEEDDRVVSRFVLRGTHRGVFLATPATGQRVEVAASESTGSSKAGSPRAGSASTDSACYGNWAGR